MLCHVAEAFKEGGLTSAPKRDASHRKHNCECYSMRFAGVMLIKKYSKSVKRFCAVFSDQNKSKIVLESVIWAYKFLIWFAGAWKLSQKTILRWNPRKIFSFLKILVSVRHLVKYEVLTPSELGDILILRIRTKNFFFVLDSADVGPPSLKGDIARPAESESRGSLIPRSRIRET